MAHRLITAIATIACLLIQVSAFVLNSKTNVAVYWGQGPYQARLIETCKNPNVDVVVIGFVNVFPDQGPGGYPGTNFGNACGDGTYTKNGKQTALLSSCPNIGPDITACQQTYKKKVLLSLGGGYPTNYFIGSDTSAVNFAKFLWNAFGPVTKQWTAAKGPRPFGNAVVDGFDFDIESQLDSPPKYNGQVVNDYKTRGYVKMIQTFRQQLYPTDTAKRYFISGAPQCIVPDAHFANAVQTAWFDFIFVQFYNTPICSARAGVNHSEGASSIDISYSKWANIKFFNSNAKIFIGLPASTSASNSYDYYLPPKEADILIRRFYGDSKFGGVMLWEATYARNNIVCGKNYPTWIKRLLQAKQSGKVLNTTTNDCPNPKIPCGTCPPNPVSQDGRCGANFGTTCTGSKFGQCCGPEGYCVNTATACSNCDSQYANCTFAASFMSKAKRDLVDGSLGASAALLVNTSATAEPASPGTIATVTSEDLASASLAVTAAALINAQVSSNVLALGSTTSIIAGSDATGSTLALSSPSASPSVGTETQPTTFSLFSVSSEEKSVAPTWSQAASLVAAVQFTDPSSSTASTTAPDTLVVTSALQAVNSSESILPSASVITPTASKDYTTATAAQIGAVSTTDAGSGRSVAISKSTKLVTIFETVFQTISRDAGVTVVSSLVPVTTSTVILTKTITEQLFVTLEAQGEASGATVIEASGVVALDVPAQAAQESDSTSTVTVNKISTILRTVTITNPAGAAIATTVVPAQQLADDGTLFNPHATDSSSSSTGPRTITLRVPVATETINVTVLYTPSANRTSTTTLKSTSTIVVTVTVQPNARFAGGTALQSGAAGAAGKVKAAVSVDNGSTVVTGSPSSVGRSAGGRLSPRHGVRESVAVMVGLFVIALLCL